MNMEDRSPRGFLDGPFGDSGVGLSFLRLELAPEVAVDRWSIFLSDLQGLLEGDEQLSIPKGKGVAFNVLPDEFGEDALYLTVKMPVGTPTAEFVLQVVPNADPPDVIRQSSNAIGGLAGFHKLLENSWPEKRMGNATVAASFDLPEMPQALSRFFPKSGPGKLEGAGISAESILGARAWTFEGSELKEAHFIRSEDFVSIWVKAEILIEIGPGMFGQAGNKLWEATHSLALLEPIG